MNRFGRLFAETCPQRVNVICGFYNLFFFFSITYRNIDTDTSDSEISVGGTQDKDDFPILPDSNICPAPRSFELTSNEISTKYVCV